MNARICWALAFVCTLNVGSLQAADQGAQTVKVMSERLQYALEEFDKAPSGPTLEPFVEELYHLPSEAPESSMGSFRTRSLVRILSAVEGKIDPDFDLNDPQDLPRRNITPPGGLYPSGVAPSSIEDEKVRREYEAAIAANAAKAATFNLQVELGRLKERILSVLEILASDVNVDKSESLKELMSLFDEYGIDEESRARILSSIKWAK